MDSKTLEQIQARVESDKEKQSLFHAYDDIDNFVWELPENLNRDFIRKRVTTIGHDALKQVDNIFDTYNPKLDVLPVSQEDVDNAEEMETWLEYHMKKANQNGETSAFRKGLHNAGKYNRVIFEVDYLPYWLPKDKSTWTKEQKANASNGPFCITAHDARNIYYEIGKYGLKWISNISCMEGQDIIDHWSVYEGNSEEGKQIKSGLAKIKSEIEDDEETEYVYVDYFSHDKRIVTAFKSAELSDLENFSADDGIDILNTENKLGFIPYAVSTGDSDPLLHSMHVSGTWENQNIIDTIVDSSGLRRAFMPVIKHTSISGKEMDIDFDGSQATIELGQGEAADILSAPPLDIGLQQLQAINLQRMAETVGIKNLGMQDLAGNVQYSTIQAQIQMQLTALQPYKRTTEKAIVQVAYIMFRWVEKAETSEVGYRTKNRVKKPGQFEGQGIMISSEFLELDEMIISCELLSNSPTDKQQEVNMFTSMVQAGFEIPQSEVMERLDFQNPQQLRQMWQDEQVEKLALQNFITEKQKEIEMKYQQIQMQMQAQLQQQQMQQQQAMQQEQMAQEQAMEQGGDINPQGQGYNPAQGGQPPMMATPGMTRNQVEDPG